MKNVIWLLVASLLLAIGIGAIARDQLQTNMPVNSRSLSRIEFRAAAYSPIPGWIKTSFGENTIYLDTSDRLCNEHVAKANVGRDRAGKNPTIDIEFTEVGAAKMAVLTMTHLHRNLAIIVDGKVISAPTIQAMISSKAKITGDFSDKEAKEIVTQIVPHEHSGEAEADNASHIEFRLVEDTLSTRTEPGTGNFPPNFGEDLVVLETPIKLTKEHIARTTVIMANRPLLKPGIMIDFTNEGAKQLAKLTAARKHKRLAIMFEGKLIGAPMLGDIPRPSPILLFVDFPEKEALRIANRIAPLSQSYLGAADVSIVEEINLIAGEATRIESILKPLLPDHIVVKTDAKKQYLLIQAPRARIQHLKNLIDRLGVVEKIIDTESLSLSAQSKQRTDALRDSVLSPGKIQQLQLKQVRTKRSLKGMSLDWQEYTKKHSLRVADMVLKSRVTELFETRQQINESDLAALELELSNARKTLDEREKNKQQIIDRRIEELKHPKPKSESPTQLETRPLN